MRREEWMKVNEWEEWKFPAVRIKRRTDQWGWNGIEEQAWCPGTWWGGKKSHVMSEVVAKKKVAASSQKKRRVWRYLSMGWGQHAEKKAEGSIICS